MEKLTIVKIGGNVIDDKQKLNAFLRDFTLLIGPKILIHGGGKLATKLSEKLNIPQQIIDGRRITNKATLELTVMVYAGLINKQIVSTLQSFECNALGLSGADGNIISANKRITDTIDYGFVGDINKDSFNVGFINKLLALDISLVLCPITNNKVHGLLNTNADTITAQLAIALQKHFNVHVIYCFEKTGVLLDVEKEDTLINSLDEKNYLALKQSNAIHNGMLPKLANIFNALHSGVSSITLCSYSDLLNSENENVGTKFIYNE